MTVMSLLSKTLSFGILIALFSGCNSLIKLGDQSYSNLIERGIQSFQKGDLVGAERSFTTATNDKTKPEGFFWLGRVKEITTPSSREDEIFLYERAIKINPNYIDPYSRLGFAFSASGNFERAREAWLKQIDLKPSSKKSALSNIGYTYFLQKNYKSAELSYRESLKDDQNYTYGLNGLGMVLGAKGDYQQAREILQKSLAVDSSDKNRGAYADFAKLEEMQGNHREARNYWEKFLSFKNNMPEDIAEATKALERLKGKNLVAKTTV
jgi:tetratricopeptide (TPR) repeat protein